MDTFDYYLAVRQGSKWRLIAVVRLHASEACIAVAERAAVGAGTRYDHVLSKSKQTNVLPCDLATLPVITYDAATYWKAKYQTTTSEIVREIMRENALADGVVL